MPRTRGTDRGYGSVVKPWRAKMDIAVDGVATETCRSDDEASWDFLVSKQPPDLVLDVLANEIHRHLLLLLHRLHG